MADNIFYSRIAETNKSGAIRAADAKWGLDQIVSQLRESRDGTHNIRHGGRIRQLPSRTVLATVADQIATVLFPTHYGSFELAVESVDEFVASTLNRALLALAQQVRLDVSFADNRAGREEGCDWATEIVRAFAAQLPEIRAILVTDVRAAYEGDPAATSYPEILLSYPGMIAIVHYRLAHALYALGARLCARLISHIAQSRTAIDIHPGASIGTSFFIDHGTGVVIGETAVIGDRVRLYQGVTLSAQTFPMDKHGVPIKGAARHPIVEDDVVIYAGATILGRITIGRGSVIGGNIWLTRSVPPRSIMSQAHLRNDSASG